MKSKKINLPRGYLSWSQVDLWSKSKKQYAKRYFYGEKGFTNKAMRYGSKFADAMETGEPSGDELLDLVAKTVEKYEVPEYKLEAVIKSKEYNVPLLGYIDTSHDPPSKGFREYKTGKIPWTQKRADNHKQLPFYALMVYLNEKKLPKSIFLDWVETEDSTGDVKFTGHVETFPTRRTVGDLMEMMTIIKRTACEISREYDKVIKEAL